MHFPHKLVRNRPHLGRSPRLPDCLPVDEGDLAVEARATLHQHGLDRARLERPLELVRVGAGAGVGVRFFGRWGKC